MGWAELLAVLLRFVEPSQPASPKNWGGLKKALGRRANSAIPRGIAVLGEGDALAARGGRAEDEAHSKEAVLLRPKGSPGLRRGIFDARAGRRSPNSTEWG